MSTTSTDPKRSTNGGVGGKGPGGPRLVYALTGALLAVLLIATAGVLLMGGDSGRGMQAIGGPFTLENGDGKTVTDKDFRGRFMLVYFGYTFCPDVCPTTLTAVADAMDKLGAKADKMQTVFITVDPKRDTPAVVKQYAAAFGPRVQGLTGTPEQIATAAKGFRVYYAEHRTGSGPGDYTMDHSSILYLIGPDGRFVAPIRADQSGEEMATALGRYLS